MAETVNQESENNQEQGGAAADEKRFTQAEVNATIQERLGREKKKYADYDELKEKAKKYDEAQEAGKTELQKAQDDAKKYKDQYEKLKAANEVAEIRAKVSMEMGVPANLLTASTEAACKEQAQAILNFANPNQGGAGYPYIRDAGESRPAGSRTTQQIFAEFMKKNFG